MLSIHRASNVDHRDLLKQYFEKIDECARYLPVICPVHPRIKHIVYQHKKELPNLYAVDAMPYPT